MSKQVNWTALNARLCEALNVPHSEECCCNSCCRTEVERVFAFVEYPYILSVDTLMPLMADRGMRCGVEWWKEFSHFGLENMGWVFTHPSSRQVKYADTPGRALSLAAAAALGVEVPQC